MTLKVFNMAEDETDSDMLSIVQKQDLPKEQGSFSDQIDRDIKAEIERGGRKQVVSISTKSSDVSSIKGSGINRIERPKKI